MSGLSLDVPGEHRFVRATGAAGIRIGDRWFTRALLLTPEEVIDDWPPQSLAELEDAHFNAIHALTPEVVLLRVGARQQFIHPKRLAGFYERNVGVEVMTTEAACRTFNVLAGDGRKVVAGLMPLGAE